MKYIKNTHIKILKVKYMYVVANICCQIFFQVANRSVELENLVLATLNFEP